MEERLQGKKGADPALVFVAITALYTQDTRMGQSSFLRIKKLEGERSSLLKKLILTEKMLEGSLVEYRRECGSKTCKCAGGKLHGPYYYLSRQVRGKTDMVYLENQKHLIEAARRYREFRKGLERVRVIGMQIEKILMEEKKRKLLKLK